MKITIRELVTEHLPAQRAELRATVIAEGADKVAVTARTRTVLAEVTQELDSLRESGAIRRWSSGQFSVWSYRPTDDRGHQLAPVHCASAEVVVRFVDFAALAGVVERWSVIDEMRIDEVEWSLRGPTREEAEGRLRAAAVQSATAKATQYARATGLRSVRATLITDNPDRDGYRPDRVRMSARSGISIAGASHLQFTPSDIAVTLSIGVEFDSE